MKRPLNSRKLQRWTAFQRKECPGRQTLSIEDGAGNPQGIILWLGQLTKKGLTYALMNFRTAIDQCLLCGCLSPLRGNPQACDACAYILGLFSRQMTYFFIAQATREKRTKQNRTKHQNVCIKPKGKLKKKNQISKPGGVEIQHNKTQDSAKEILGGGGCCRDMSSQSQVMDLILQTQLRL